ncbi:MAG: putative glycoside hydrolase [Thermoanaerobaculaceae bacterium]
MDSLSVPNYLGHDHYRPVLPAVDEGVRDDVGAAHRRLARLVEGGSSPARHGSCPTSGPGTPPARPPTTPPPTASWSRGSRWTATRARTRPTTGGCSSTGCSGSPAAGKALLAQTYVDGAQERLFTLGSYLLVKGSRTYLNFETSDAPDWWPEYDVPIGAALQPPAASVDALQSAVPGVYTRAFDNGSVWVNPAPSWDGGPGPHRDVPPPRATSPSSRGGGEVGPGRRDHGPASPTARSPRSRSSPPPARPWSSTPCRRPASPAATWGRAGGS